VALKQAKYVREDNPNGKAYILYQHMRTPGNMELFYKSAQNDDGIFLTKANVMKVEEGSDGSLTVEAEDTLLNENLSRPLLISNSLTGMQTLILSASHTRPGEPVYMPVVVCVKLQQLMRLLMMPPVQP
jgi:quinone-modifying oxidoreductase subunit QmoB